MTEVEGTRSPVLYGRFSARLRAFYIDVIVTLVAMAAALIVATVAESEFVSRVVGFSFLVALVLFEPILVSTFGSSVGHYLNNLRVVDNRTGGRVDFGKAVARTAIKFALGVYSFVSMMTTSRHQALHDWMTASTVQIRNPEIARPSDYVHERVELSRPEMPSWYRRVAVIVGHLVLMAVGAQVVALLLLSKGCITSERCTPLDDVLVFFIGLGAIVLALFTVGFGWRGKLYGARFERPTYWTRDT